MSIRRIKIISIQYPGNYQALLEGIEDEELAEDCGDEDEEDEDDEMNVDGEMYDEPMVSSSMKNTDPHRFPRVASL